MSWRLPGCRLPPRPPLRKSERGRILVALLFAGALGCRPAAQAAVADSSVGASQGRDTTLVDDNPIRAAFLNRYAGLERMGDGWGVLLYPKGRGRVINLLRSDLPQGSSLPVGEGLELEDRVYALLVLPGAPAESVYVIHSEGPSGDPSFYLADGRSGETTYYIQGEILVFPDSGPMMMYQRTNTEFPTVKEVRLHDGRFEETDSTRYVVGLRTIALDTLRLWRSPEDSTPTAVVMPHDSVVVVEARARDPHFRRPLLIQASSGVRGWALLPSRQCYSMAILGICYLGD